MFIVKPLPSRGWKTEDGRQPATRRFAPPDSSARCLLYCLSSDSDFARRLSPLVSFSDTDETVHSQGAEGRGQKTANYAALAPPNRPLFSLFPVL
ncbi:MAG: hypothetical protein LBD06_03565 [Candidatus Accumulibacter sp.]|nr:hypothetical protein [Accumulibacter sp.]